MKDIISNQAYLFTIYFICGILIGIFFDLFRILRKAFNTSDLITYIEDIIFGILTGIFLIFMLFIFNNGQLRFYIFLAIIIGLTIYIITISKYFIKINVKIIVTTKKVVKKIIAIILYPIKKLYNVIKRYVLKPFKILTINIRNIHIQKKSVKSNSKSHFKKGNRKKSKKNGENKKDFIK